MIKDYLAWAVFTSTALLVSSTGCGTPSRALGNSDDTDESDVVVVKTLVPERIELSRTSRQPATVSADQQAEIYAKVTGYLDELRADIGAEVGKGDVLAIISVPEMMKQRQRHVANLQRLEAQERRAAAEVDVARAAGEKSRANVRKTDAKLFASRIERERVSDLVDRKAIANRLLDESTQQFEESAAEKAAAEEDVKLADANLVLSHAMADAAAADTEVARRELEEMDEMMKYAQLTVPFDGVVTARDVDVGDLVRNTQASSGRDGSPLFVVAKLDKVRVRVAIPERDATLVDEGDPAHVTLQAMGGQTIDAKVSRVSRGLDERTRTMLVEIDLPNPDRKLLPGMFGQAIIELEANKSRLVLPASYVRYDEHGRSYVYVVNSSSQIDVVDVKTGLDDGQQIEITDGLSGNERVVAPMLRRLSQGQSVKVDE